MSKGRSAPVGATRWSPNGYHYTKTEEGWELTHRLTAATKLGRPLLPTERVRFVNGYSKTDYDNPNAIEVSQVQPNTKAKRRAVLEARLEAIKAELAELELES